MNVLSFSISSSVRLEEEEKIYKLESELKELKNGMNRMLLLIQQNPLLVNVKPEALKTK